MYRSELHKKKYASVGGLDNKLLHDMTLKMQEKYDKHWGKTAKTNFFLYIAFILNPRYKMKFLMYSLTQLFDMDPTKEVENKVKFVLRRLFSEYSLNDHSHEGSSSSIASSQLQVLKDCTCMSQPLVCSTSTSSSSFFTTSKTSSSASDVFRIHFEDMDEEDVLSVHG